LLPREDLVQNRWLSQIVFLLWILALSLILAFCYFASSLCITLLLASFLAIVVDPLIMYFELAHFTHVIRRGADYCGNSADRHASLYVLQTSFRRRR
jgi:hypothetical protein